MASEANFEKLSESSFEQKWNIFKDILCARQAIVKKLFFVCYSRCISARVANNTWKKIIELIFGITNWKKCNPTYQIKKYEIKF